MNNGFNAAADSRAFFDFTKSQVKVMPTEGSYAMLIKLEME